ncbi:MAG: hypothetical protein M3081_12890 [Gemmatimonadota bacterium]|nr:hypothetical protein [Gemmatimonadota bacterium]
MTRNWSLVRCALLLAVIAACSDSKVSVGPAGRTAFERYVSIGTSVSMGWNADGVTSSTQQHAWPVQLAAFANVSFSVPLIQSPGCTPPIITPLAFQKRLDNTSAAASSSVCAANFPGIVLPTNNVAISGAKASDAFLKTGASSVLASRVLPPTLTQVTAMLAQKPTFVSVELGANEVLGTTSGLLLPNATLTPADTFFKYFDGVVDSVAKTGARAVLAGLVADVKSFPSIRSGSEIAADSVVLFNQWYVQVTDDCGKANANNLLFIPRTVLVAIATGSARAAAGLSRATLSCADVPFTGTNLTAAQDGILTPADRTAINALLLLMSDHIKAKATSHGWAYFELNSLYSLPKAPFSSVTLMTDVLPYGANFAADGVHPSAAGHTILARAAAHAINILYNFSILE